MSDIPNLPQGRAKHADTQNSHPSSWKIELLERFVIQSMFRRRVIRYRKICDNSNAKVHNGDKEEAGSPAEKLCEQSG
jgi:hypothetical protein